MSVSKTIWAGHEQDDLWSAVDGYTLSHPHPSSNPANKVLSKTLSHSVDRGLPNIATYPAQSKFLMLQCKLGGIKHVLELGCLGGYTPIWLTSQIPDLHVTTIEIDPYHAEVARENIRNAGVQDRVEVIVGAGLDVLPKLQAEVAKGSRPPFGMTYIDADKENNWKYFKAALDMSRKGALIIVDNVVRQGKIVQDEWQGNIAVKGSREVIEKAGKEKRVDAVVMQTVAEKSYDGFLYAVVVE